MSTVSIFVPIYNAEQYLRQCVDSILGQSYKDIEVLLCNDHSTDSSPGICCEYEMKDRRVRVIHNEKNMGLYNSRLKILDLMTGKYFFQVDSDDWIDKDCIKTMVEKAESYHVDVVTVGFIRTLDKWGLIHAKSYPYKPGLYTKEDLAKYHHIYTQRVFYNNVWEKLIRMDVIMACKPQPSDIHFGEDLLFTQSISPAINSIYVCDYQGYYYRYGGSTMNYHSKFLADHCKLYWLRKDYALKYEPDYVHGLTLFFLDIVKSVIRNKIFFYKSNTKFEEVVADLQAFYSTKEYEELIALEDDDMFLNLLRKKDSEGIIRFIKNNNSTFDILRTKWIAKGYNFLSSFSNFILRAEGILCLRKRHVNKVIGQHLVSVFVPVYNSEKFLRQCVESILNQTYYNLEIILFNDASNDHSLEICREYEAKDRRVRVIDSSVNKGIYNSRLCVLELIQGEYFFQVDSDDWIDSDYIQTAVECAEQHDVDIVAMGFKRTMDSRGWLKQSICPYKEQKYDSEAMKKYHSIYTQKVFSNNVWSKLFRTKVFERLDFHDSDIHFGDDLLFLQEISPYIHSLYSLPVCKYYYRYGGSTSTFNPKFWTDHSKLYWLRKKYAQEHEPEYLPGLKHYFLNTFKDVIKYRLCLVNSPNRRTETVEFVNDFYTTDEYKELMSIEDSQDEFLQLLREKDTESVVKYIEAHVSRWSVMRTKLLSGISRLVSA